MIEIIPAIDIIDAKCVRLSKGDYEQKKVYNEDPLEVALQFESHGLKRLHLVDLDGAKAQKVVNWKVLEKIAGKTNLTIDFGGGIKSDDDMRIVFESGAEMATIGSIAVKKPDLFEKWLGLYGSEKIILGADVNKRKIAVSGWLEVTEIDILDFLKEYIDKGVKNVLCTDISKDGMLQGTSHELYKELVEGFSEMYLIASGGITEISELQRLNKENVAAAVVGKAIYEGFIKLEELERLIVTNEFN